MKKLVALIAILTLGVTAVAVAQSSQTNDYDVSFKVRPKPHSATKKKPQPVGLKVGWDVSEQSGLRPAVVNTYSVGIFGGITNGRYFPTCTAEEINAAQSDSVCPKGSKIGAGKINNAVGAANNLSDTSIPCDATHTIYNSGQGKAAIFIEGAPPKCAVSLATAIDARFVPIMGGKGTAMQFDVPESLKHPVAGLDLAVTKVTANLPKQTVKVKGKRHGFWEVVERCPKSRKAPVEFEFTTEAGTKSTMKDTVACRR